MVIYAEGKIRLNDQNNHIKTDGGSCMGYHIILSPGLDISGDAIWL